VGGDGRCRDLRRRALDGGAQVLAGELCRIGVQTEADLAAALLDERRKPVRERNFAQS